jgi:hypothetical protein
MGGVEVRPAGGRFATRASWLDSRHSFSFGRHYAPDNTHFGLLVACNDDRVSAGAGYDTHPHRDVEIVTWVLSGSLVHRDSEGHADVVYPGLAQQVSAGRGIRHSERNDAWRLTGSEPHGAAVRFVQMWVHPDEPGGDPGYGRLDVADALAGGGLVPVASGRRGHDGALPLRQREAALHVARLPSGGSVVLPNAPYVHLFVAGGSVELEAGGRLAAGDSARITDGAGLRAAGTGGPAELLVWEMHRALR